MKQIIYPSEPMRASATRPHRMIIAILSSGVSY